MPEKPTALVVDDDDEWLSILEETLMPGFQVVKAKTPKGVIKILENKDLKLEIALVDIRLNEENSEDKTGLDVMFILNEQGVPCIGATVYNDGKSIRDALITGGAKDVWFKSQEELVILRHKIKSVIDSEKKISAGQRNLAYSPVFQSANSKIDPKLVFVIMPFSEKWSDEVLILIKSVAEKHKLKVVRADDIFASHNVVDDIWQLINRAGIIIADITAHNANVFYELGIAHTLGKDFILIWQASGDKPPFDIAVWRYFEYELMPTKAEEFRNKLSKVLQSHRKKHKI